jgi:hypothetical protein
MTPRLTADELRVALDALAELRALEADQRERENITGPYRRHWTLSAPAALLFHGVAVEDEQQRAAERIADVIGFIGRPRMRAHADEVLEALRAQADSTGCSIKAARRSVYARALRIVAVEARKPQPTLRVDDKYVYRRAKPDGPGRAAIPLADVGYPIFHKWATTRVADEVMGELVPEWRALERDEDVEIIPLDALLGRHGDEPMIETDFRASRRAGTQALITLLETMRPQDVALAKLVYERGMTQAGAAAEVGLSPATARQRLVRMRKVLASLSQPSG